MTERWSDATALEYIHALMSGRRWDGAADLLDAIAGAVTRTGRVIEEAKDNAPRWDEVRG